MTLRGDRALRRELMKLQRKFPKLMAEALTEEAFEIFAESQEEVPVDTGRLQDSGVVGRADRSGEPVVIIAYGTDYALPVHERTEVRHVTGKAKFLEDPFNRARPGMARRMASSIKRKAGI